jgi:hypothetical protein
MPAQSGGGKDRAATANGANNNGQAPAPPAPPTDVTLPAPPPVLDPAAMDAAAAAAAASAAPPPDTSTTTAPGPVPVVPIDQSILDTLASAKGDKPPDNGSMLLIGAGIALALFVLSVAAWAFYHRSSRYLPA